MRQYIVQKGDTLYGIAKQFGTTVDEIKRLNNLNSNVLSIGQILTIKEDTSIPTTYTVVRGDSLYGVGKKFNISVLDLMKYNNLTSTVLQVGQVLKLTPSNMEDEIMVVPIYENYTVKKGDNLYSIAKRYNTTVDQIKKDNNLTSNNLFIGQVLRIKVGEDMVGVEECFGTGYDGGGNNTPNYLTYTVKKGDSLYSIARNYNTTVDNIMKLNNLKSTVLSVGQVLKIKEVN